MASHGNDTNKVNLLMSFSSFFFLCLSACLSFCLSYNVGHLLNLNEFSFVFLSFLYVCLSNKGHLLMSFPLFFFLFCLCACLSVKQRSFINDFSFVLICPVGWWGVLQYKSSTGMCRPKAPHFSAWPLLKTPLFRPGLHRKTPLFKNIYLFVPFFRHGLLQKTPL